MKYPLLLLCFSTVFYCVANTNKKTSTSLADGTKPIIQGTNYSLPDIQPPGTTPALFAKGLISLPKIDESCFELSVTGNEIQFCRDGNIFLMSFKNSEWTKPTVAPFSGNHSDGESCFSPDGKRIYFASNRPLQGAVTALNTWYAEKNGDHWSSAKPLKLPSGAQTVHAVSFSNDGTIYCSGIKRITFKDGKYRDIENLQPAIKGAHPFVSPDESYIIFDSNSDLYIAYQKSDGSYTSPIKLGNGINTASQETNAFISHDQKYLFFTRNFDIYWVDAGFIPFIKSKSEKN